VVFGGDHDLAKRRSNGGEPERKHTFVRRRNPTEPLRKLDVIRTRAAQTIRDDNLATDLLGLPHELADEPADLSPGGKRRQDNAARWRGGSHR
jgi:hypothetical protein